MGLNKVYFEEQAVRMFFALYFRLLQQPFVVMYRLSNKLVIGFSSLEILPLSQPEPEQREGY